MLAQIWRTFGDEEETYLEMESVPGRQTGGILFILNQIGVTVVDFAVSISVGNGVVCYRADEIIVIVFTVGILVTLTGGFGYLGVIETFHVEDEVFVRHVGGRAAGLV